MSFNLYVDVYISNISFLSYYYVVVVMSSCRKCEPGFKEIFQIVDRSYMITESNGIIIS